VDLQNFATASRRYTGGIHKWSVVGLFMTHVRQWKRLGRVMVECTLSITHCLRLNLQLHTIDLVRTCISSFCTVAWQLARFQLTRHIARSLGDSWAFCRLCHSVAELCTSPPVFHYSYVEQRQCYAVSESLVNATVQRLRHGIRHSVCGTAAAVKAIKWSAEHRQINRRCASVADRTDETW